MANFLSSRVDGVLGRGLPAKVVAGRVYGGISSHIAAFAFISMCAETAREEANGSGRSEMVLSVVVDQSTESFARRRMIQPSPVVT